MDQPVFRKVWDQEVPSAHQILVDAVDWLLSRGIRQWTIPFPRETYNEYQSRGENYLLASGDHLLTVISLRSSISKDWQDEIGPGEQWWLSNLATNKDAHGHGFGKRTVNEVLRKLVCNHVADVYLDVVRGNGFLLDFYAQFGFHSVASKEIVYSTGPFDMVLMHSRISSR